MNRIKVFFQEAYQELRYKVSWPTWTELQGSTTVVLVSFVVIAISIFIMDWASSTLLDLFYNNI